MPKNSEDKHKAIKKLFNSKPTPNQKAWRLIHEFYNIILTEMEERNISRTELAKRLGTTKAAVSKILNNSPNITVRKMVELSYSVGIDLKFTTVQLEKKKEEILFEKHMNYKANDVFIFTISGSSKETVTETPFKYKYDMQLNNLLVSESVGGYNA